MNAPYVFRKCNKCGEWLVVHKINFHKQKNGKYGLRGICKKCNKKYRDNNKNHKKEYSKKYYQNNKEHFKKYRDDNKDSIKEYKKEYYQNNKEYIKNWKKQYRDNNKDLIKEYNKKYNSSEQGQRTNFNNNQKRRMLLEEQDNLITTEQWKEMMDFFDWKCAYSNQFIYNKDIRTIDHIVPLNKNGLNVIWNLVPMYRNYNCSKHNRYDVMNWYKEQEYFSEERLAKIVEWQQYAYEKWATEKDDELILITDLK